jgi:hypothetical protein
MATRLLVAVALLLALLFALGLLGGVGSVELLLWLLVSVVVLTVVAVRSRRVGG